MSTVGIAPRRKQGEYLTVLLMLFVLSILTYLPFDLLDLGTFSIRSGTAYLMLGIVGLVSIAMLVVEARKCLLLNVTHWVFVYLFFFLAPLAQYSAEAF